MSAAACRCGHPKSPDHDREGFAPQCTAERCTCLHYRPTAAVAAKQLPPKPEPQRQVTVVQSSPSTADIAAPTLPPTFEQIIAAGKRSEQPRIARLAEKITGMITDLRDRIHAEAEAAEARADIERLEKQLADAKAKLRPARPAAGKSATAEDLSCPDCGKSFGTAQGRGAHRAHAHGYRRPA